MSEESRLGREQIEVSYALKQMVTTGVRVFLYLTDTERTLDSPLEKTMLALQAMADEMERRRGFKRRRKPISGSPAGSSGAGPRPGSRADISCPGSRAVPVAGRP